jgi:hypothetical protein
LNFSPILKFEFTFLALNKEHGRSIHRLPSRLGSAVSKTLAESGIGGTRRLDLPMPRASPADLTGWLHGFCRMRNRLLQSRSRV